MFPRYLLIFYALLFAALNTAALYYDRAYPYYPIELSRLAASGPIALGTFKLFAGGMIGLLIAMREKDRRLWAMCASFAAVAFLDDVNYLFAHLAAVSALVASMAMLALTGPARHDPATFRWNLRVAMLGVGIYMSRALLRAFALWWFEDVDPLSLAALQLAQDIMYRGAAACAHVETLHFFRASGLLQWVAFAVFSRIRLEAPFPTTTLEKRRE